MARELRIQYPGAIYHVINRGDRREPIFNDDHDRTRFLETIAETCAKTGWPSMPGASWAIIFISSSRRPRPIWSRA
jgi:hypothetical protein